MLKKKGTILVFVPHSDDQVLGCGGAIAKYSAEGYEVKTIICSFGEMSHPHLRPEVIRKARVLEAKKADQILGGSGVSFLGLREGKFWDDLKKNNARIKKNLIKRIKELKPDKIFAPDANDGHPDHKATHAIIAEVISRARIQTELYAFAVYKLVNFKRARQPCLYVDITPYFKKKIEALHAFKSQIGIFTHAQTNNVVYLSIYVKAFVAGMKKGVRYAETFYKVEL